MDESIYHIEGDKALNSLIEFLEELENSHDISSELEQGVINVIMPGGKQYVINKHAPSRQVWVSSPYTGAGYFEFKEGKWLPKRSEAAQGKELFEFITEEIKSHLD